MFEERRFRIKPRQRTRSHSEKAAFNQRGKSFIVCMFVVFPLRYEQEVPSGRINCLFTTSRRVSLLLIFARNLFYRVFLVPDPDALEVRLKTVLINQFYEESSTWSRYVEC